MKPTNWKIIYWNLEHIKASTRALEPRIYGLEHILGNTRAYYTLEHLLDTRYWRINFKNTYS